MNEKFLDEEKHGSLYPHGYKPAIIGDAPWQGKGMYLYNVTDDEKDYWFDPDTWMDLLKAQARKEHRQWTLNKQTFPSALVRMGIAMPSENRRSANLLRIAGKPQRRLHITNSLLDTPPEDDDRAVTNKEAVAGAVTSEAVTPTRDNSKVSSEANSEYNSLSVTASTNEKSGYGERLQKEAISNGSIGQLTEGVTAVTAVTAKRDPEYTMPPSESDLDLEEERSIQSVKRFLAKCTKRGVHLSLGDDGTLRVASIDTALIEPTKDFIAKHEVAFNLVLAECLQQSKVQISHVGDQWDMTL